MGQQCPQPYWHISRCYLDYKIIETRCFELFTLQILVKENFFNLTINTQLADVFYQHLEITKKLLYDLPKYYIVYVIMNLYVTLTLYISMSSVVRKYCFETLVSCWRHTAISIVTFDAIVTSDNCISREATARQQKRERWSTAFP